MEKLVKMFDFTYSRDKVNSGTRDFYGYGLIAKLTMDRIKESAIGKGSISIEELNNREALGKVISAELDRLEEVLSENQEIMSNILDVIYYYFIDLPEKCQVGGYTPVKTKEQVLKLNGAQ